MTGSLVFYRKLGFAEQERRTEGGQGRICLARRLPARAEGHPAPARLRE